MDWMKLREVNMKESLLRRLMFLHEKYEDLFLEKNFKLFNDKLKKELEMSRKVDLTEKLEEYEKNKVRIINANDWDYPVKLREITDYPLFLYVKGKTEFFNYGINYRKKFSETNDSVYYHHYRSSGSGNFNGDRKHIGVVGTRRSTKFGRSACEKVVRELLNYDIILVSGLAEGIDTIALSTVVDKNKKSIAVVGSGLDVVYPYENKRLWEKISEEGLLISELPLGTKPLKWNFPKRNRIIAGLSDGILIAESFKSGGALITAELGFSMDREIFAIPGFINYPSFEGCNNLIKENKAKLVTCGEDIAIEFLWDLKSKKSRKDKLDDEERLVFSQLKEETSLEELVKINKMATNSILSILMRLKLKGLITETGTAKYMRIV